MTILGEALPLSGDIQSEPRYDLSAEELATVENSLVQDAKSTFGEGVTAAWIDPRHEYANFVRTQEALHFPEVSALDERYDNAQSILTLVDTRPNSEKVLHAATMMRLRQDAPKFIAEGSNETGFYTIDSLIKLGNFTAQEFMDFYIARGIDLDKSIAAETNFKIHTKMERFHMLGSADLVYLTLYNQLIRDGAEIGKTVVFATANDKQWRSLQRTGLTVEPLMGRTEFHTEEGDLGKESRPIVIHMDDKGYEIFGKEINMELPELHYYPETSTI